MITVNSHTTVYFENGVLLQLIRLRILLNCSKPYVRLNLKCFLERKKNPPSHL